MLVGAVFIGSILHDVVVIAVHVNLVLATVALEAWATVLRAHLHVAVLGGADECALLGRLGALSQSVLETRVHDRPLRALIDLHS